MSPTSVPCSTQWNVPGLPVWGTAPRALFWVAMEQNGPWGGRAWVESGLAPDLGGAIESACLAHGGRGLLVRDPMSHADSDGGSRRVFVSGGSADHPWLVHGVADDPRQVLALPFPVLGSVTADEVLAEVPWLSRHREGVLLVCGNGRRDACCARLGGPMARQLVAAHPDRVWESSHLGGHRFAPTALALPTGQLLGRLTGSLALAALAALAHGQVVCPGPDHDRGRSHFAPARQVAEAFVRHQSGVRDLRAFEVGHPSDSGLLPVRWAATGERREVAVEQAPDVPRAESCGAEPIAGTVWTASWADIR